MTELKKERPISIVIQINCVAKLSRVLRFFMGEEEGERKPGKKREYTSEIAS